MPQVITVQTFCLGEWMTNCYVIHTPASTHCWIIDAGFAPANLIRYIQQQNLAPERIVLTHAHVDHIAGLNAVRAVWPDLPIWIHEADRDFLTDPWLNLSAALDESVITPPATNLLKHGDTIAINDVGFQVRHTPGHSPGGISLYQPENKIVFVGDALFAGSIGRYDFPTSNGEKLFQSIRDQLLTLPDETTLYAGHGGVSTIGSERASNPYLQNL